MRSYTQISSGSQSEALSELKEKLNGLDIHVTPAPTYENTLSLWQTYSSELQFYKSIAKSSFHILYNDVAITDIMAMQALYAVYKKRPIIIIGRLLYDKSLNPELQKILEAHARKFRHIDILALEFAELSFALNKLKPAIDYRLTREEEEVIVSIIRERLYSMVGQGIGEMNAPLK
jgi:hypothetical protein